MPMRNIDLTSHYDRFVDEQIASGRFTDAGEVIRAGLRLLEQQSAEDQEKIAALRALTAQAFDELDRGRGTILDGSIDLEQHIAALGRNALMQVSQPDDIE